MNTEAVKTAILEDVKRIRRSIVSEQSVNDSFLGNDELALWCVEHDLEADYNKNHGFWMIRKVAGL